jgi:tetratricopeptide (TPR) repeat protein
MRRPTADLTKFLQRLSGAKSPPMFRPKKPLLERALGIYEEVLGPDHPKTNVSRYGLVRLLLKSRQLSEALALAEKELSISDKILGPAHRGTKFAALNVAEALHRLDRVDEAVALFRRYGIDPSDKTTWS